MLFTCENIPNFHSDEIIQFPVDGEIDIYISIDNVFNFFAADYVHLQ